MASTKIEAGATLDVLTRAELAEVLRSWQTELTRGVKSRRLSLQGNVNAAGVLLIGGPDDGPAEGMAWAITRLSVAPGPALPASGLNVYANTVESQAALLIAGLLTNVFPGDRGCVLLSGDHLQITASGMVAATQVTVTLQIKEVPIQQIWSL